MAENTRRMNNEPVFGSLAYDLNTLNWGEFDGNAVRQPQEQPQEPLRRPEPVSYTHLTLPTNREV